MEVWFDQSELRGGDVWDQAIHRQIRDCALFIPVISAHTQARLEPGRDGLTILRDLRGDSRYKVLLRKLKLPEN